jgi:3-deoxy-manno-octulosonate cytidylyltransferase (CMP-KDO synthetase)
MSSFTRTLGVIPARLASTRLPRKMLREIAGKPLLAWVVQAAKRCKELDEVLVATDSGEVAALCHNIDVRCEITSPELPSGTDRIHAISHTNDADIYVNIQGDEPLLRPEHIADLLRPFSHAQKQVDVATLKVRCTPENIANPNAVKVVSAADGRALYFSRATIPYDRDGISPEYWKHIGLYAYRKAALERFPSLPPSALERVERLEQLRFLENGLSVYVEATEHDTIGVDTEADLQLVDRLLRERRL